MHIHIAIGLYTTAGVVVIDETITLLVVIDKLAILSKLLIAIGS